MFELYHNYGATCGRVARLAFTEKEVAYEDRIVDTQNQGQFDPAYMKLNPNAYVPTLVHDGRVIIESSVICNYIDDLCDGPALKPSDPYDRARMYFRIKMRDERYHYAINALTFGTTSKQRFGDWSEEKILEYANKIPDAGRRQQRLDTVRMGLDAPQVRAGVRTLDTALQQMEDDDLSHGPWLAGANYTLADSTMTPYVARLEHLGYAQMWTQSRPRVTDWWERIKARPSYEAVIGQYMPAAQIAEMQKAGAKAWPVLQGYLQDD